jgi:hypothetical protein
VFHALPALVCACRATAFLPVGGVVALVLPDVIPFARPSGQLPGVTRRARRARKAGANVCRAAADTPQRAVVVAGWWWWQLSSSGIRRLAPRTCTNRRRSHMYTVTRLRPGLRWRARALFPSAGAPPTPCCSTHPPAPPQQHHHTAWTRPSRWSRTTMTRRGATTATR